jgi:hypothetical protein
MSDDRERRGSAACLKSIRLKWSPHALRKARQPPIASKSPTTSAKSLGFLQIDEEPEEDAFEMLGGAIVEAVQEDPERCARAPRNLDRAEGAAAGSLSLDATTTTTTFLQVRRWTNVRG